MLALQLEMQEGVCGIHADNDRPASFREAEAVLGNECELNPGSLMRCLRLSEGQRLIVTEGHAGRRRTWGRR